MGPFEATKTLPIDSHRPPLAIPDPNKFNHSVIGNANTEQSKSDILIKQLIGIASSAVSKFYGNGSALLKTENGKRDLLAFIQKIESELPDLYSLLGNEKYCLQAVTQFCFLSSLYKTAGVESKQIDEAVLSNLHTISVSIQHADSDAIKCLYMLTDLCAKETLSDSQRNRIIDVLASKYDVYLEDFSSPTFGTGTRCCLRTLIKYGDSKQQQDADHALTAYSLFAYYTAHGKKLDDIAQQLSYYFDHDSLPGDRAIGEKIIGKICEEYGLDTKEILDWWDNAGDDYEQKKPDGTTELVKRKHIVFERNIAAMRALESQRKGILKALRDEFGIRNFGRYPRELLIKQFDEMETQQRYGIVISAKTDHNGGFLNSLDWIRTLYKELEDLNPPCAMRIVEVDGKKTLGRFYAQFDHKYGQANKLSYGIYQGHGTITSIELNAKAAPEDSEINISDLTDPLRMHYLRQYYINHKSRPTIILNSCSTGATNGIGKEIEARGHVILMAPSKPSPIKEIHVKNGNPEQPIIFDTTYHDQDALKVYKETPFVSTNIQKIRQRRMEEVKRRRSRERIKQMFNRFRS